MGQNETDSSFSTAANRKMLMFLSCGRQYLDLYQCPRPLPRLSNSNDPNLNKKTSMAKETNGNKEIKPAQMTAKNLLYRFKFRKDHRASLPPIISRFTGYRPPG